MDTNAVEVAGGGIQARVEAVQAFIFHHIADSHTLKLPFATIELPPYLSLHGLMLALAILILTLLLGLGYNRRARVPTGLSNALEAFVVFIRDKIAVPYLGDHDGRRMTPFFCSLFCFIVALNLIGLVPCFYSATADLSVTGGLALVSLAAMIGGGVWRFGPVGFVRSFVPHGVPWPVLILLVPIEIVGLFIKAFALTVRLFANELAGHIVVYFMLGLLVIFGLAALPFFFMGVLIYILEVGVAFLQAYIFTMLSAVFIGQRLHPEH
jgi:F-type H+-transporting ATPase subunit a